MEVCHPAWSQAVRADRSFLMAATIPAQKRRRFRWMETGKTLSSAQTTGKRLKTNKLSLKIDEALRSNRIFERFPFR
jgi:hypothetical protein